MPGRILPILALLALFPAALPAEELLVFAAASLTEALEEVGASWKSSTGEATSFSFAGSSTLAHQIEAGAPADLFVSADEAKIDDLVAKGLLDPGTRRELLSNRLVVVVAAERGAAVSTLADLVRPDVESIALAEPATVPAGIYARAALERAGLWEQVQTRVIPTENVRAALAAVEAGNATAAIVYATDARIARRVRVAFEIAAELTPKIVYVAAVPRAAPHAAAARRLLDFLASGVAAEIFARHGFLPLADGAP